MKPMPRYFESPRESKFSPEEVEAAKEAFEALARRLDQLWHQPHLSAKEESEVDLILNNATVVQEILEGKTPEEFEGQAA